jgi:hypothetical protein
MNHYITKTQFEYVLDKVLYKFYFKNSYVKRYFMPLVKQSGPFVLLACCSGPLLWIILNIFYMIMFM